MAATVSSRPRWSGEDNTVTTTPITPSGSHGLGMSARISPAPPPRPATARGRPALDERAERPGDVALELLALGAQPLAREDDEEVAHVDERSDRTRDAVGHGDLADPGCAEPLPGAPDRHAGELVEERLAVGE